jgi:hypothetical protein
MDECRYKETGDEYCMCYECHKRILGRGYSTRQWTAVKALSKKLGTPRLYQDDLLIDRVTLSKSRPDWFVWGVRETGTDVILPTEQGLEWAKACVKHGTNIWYVYEEGKLRQIPAWSMLGKLEERLGSADLGSSLDRYIGRLSSGGSSEGSTSR